MGLKGWLAWRLKMRKTSLNAFQALVSAIIDYVIRESGGDVNSANDKLFKIGTSMAETLLFEYSDSIGEHATTFDGFLKTFNLATKVMMGRAFDEAYWDATERKIVYAYKECPICEGVKISEEYRGLKYCHIMSGVFNHVLTLRGFSGECEEVRCKTWGDEACVWELRER
jgi:predicted hydrocarbon binding protein